jgi:hypothetical protein
VELAVGGYAPVSAGSIGLGGAQARFFRFSSALATCLVTPARGFELGGCVELQAGAVQGDGDTGFTAGRSDTVLDLTAAGALAALWPLSPGLALSARVGPLVPIVRPRFFVDAADGSEQLVYRAESIGFFASLGAELRFD